MEPSPPQKPSKFAVYQNPALSAALTAKSLQPSNSTLLCIFAFSSASAFALLSIISRENGLIAKLRFGKLSQAAAYFFAKAVQTMIGLIFIGSLSALLKFISLRRASKGTKDQPNLTNQQLGLLGIKPKVEQVVSESSKKPPKSRSHLSSPDVLVPLHQPISSSNRKPRLSSDKSNTSGGNRMNSFSTTSKLQSSPSSLYLVPAASSPLPAVQTSPGRDQVLSTPWSSKRSSYTREITTEEELENFLAEVSEKINESAGKLATPPPTVNGFGIASPTVASSANTSGTTRSTPLRPVRMSPGSQKFTTPPKKGEGDFPPPMSMEEAIEAFENLGIYPQIELWRDRLRQWFSSVLLNPLLNKLETSHIQVMNAAAKLGISITINPVGSDLPTSGSPATVSPIDRTKEWQPAFTLDEDNLLHQLRASLVQTLDASVPKFTLANLQQSPQQNHMIPVMQECVDAITEHQRLHALMKGEWVKGLLPQSSIRADYTVQRIRELAEGTCLKNYEYLGSGEVYDKKNKKWTLELPTDSHLLLYLFCAFLEHPKWMLHVDPTSYAGAQSSKNPLFWGVLPPKDRFPEKYIAVISGVPSTLHPGACVLVVGKQSSPIFALYWDKKLQFPLQGRTALWDSILLLCHRIKVGYGGIVRGMHLGSSALSILPVFESENED
ncbi:transmembrane protein 209-like [Pistacia vera]|uniref:transmembrane protein 209 n=1 Tax=Pistacia vera TaxID=55513 RepID=UPI001262D350|nr:transmembrane protein 209 [Pistacia vera]XP_031268147.1 transmembrane protein 209-like [Pistacia vera]